MRSLIKNVVALATCHWLTMAGVAITTGSAVVFVSLMLLGGDGSYVGILLFLCLPAFFVLGLILVPVGLYVRSKQVGGYREILTPFTWRDESVVRLLIVLTAATGVNVALLSTMGSQGIQYMESAAFCGETCHSVMGPQYTAYQASLHAEVACVSCHAPPDASSFVYHKLDGLRQVAALVTDTYDRPIPSSGGRLHTASETCGGCHRTDTWTGNPEQLRVIRRYAEDESSTPRTTVLLLHVERIHEAHGAGKIQYASEDDTQQVIPWFSIGGVEYVAGVRPETESRVMDCIDCHNRVGHDFGSAESAVDRAIQEGQLDRAVPFAKRNALRFLVGDAVVEDAPDSVRSIRSQSVFTGMLVSWDTYPNHIGHESSPGCFRCHDNDHQNTAGDRMGQGCFSCHTLLAVDDENPEILETLGIVE